MSSFDKYSRQAIFKIKSMEDKANKNVGDDTPEFKKEEVTPKFGTLSKDNYKGGNSLGPMFGPKLFIPKNNPFFVPEDNIISEDESRLASAIKKPNKILVLGPKSLFVKNLENSQEERSTPGHLMIKLKENENFESFELKDSNFREHNYEHKKYGKLRSTRYFD